MKSESIKKVTSQAIKQLVEALNAGHSEALARHLAAMAKFRAYSLLNVLLILKQCPNAARVAGYRTWQSFGRQVRQGEKGIVILAPMFRKPADETDKLLRSYLRQACRQIKEFRQKCDPRVEHVLVTPVEMCGEDSFSDTAEWYSL